MQRERREGEKKRQCYSGNVFIKNLLFMSGVFKLNKKPKWKKKKQKCIQHKQQKDLHDKQAYFRFGQCSDGDFFFLNSLE